MCMSTGQVSVHAHQTASQLTITHVHHLLLAGLLWQKGLGASNVATLLGGALALYRELGKTIHLGLVHTAELRGVLLALLGGDLLQLAAASDDGSHQALHLNAVEVLLRLPALVLGHVANGVSVGGQVEEAAHLVGALGEQEAVVHLLKLLDLLLTAADDDQVQNDNVGGNDGTTDGTALALALAANVLPVTDGATSKEKLHTGVDSNTGLHREALTVRATSNLEDVAGITQLVSLDLITDRFVNDSTDLHRVINIDLLLRTSRRVLQSKEHESSTQTPKVNNPSSCGLILTLNGRVLLQNIYLFILMAGIS